MIKRLSDISFKTVRITVLSDTGAALGDATGFFCKYNGDMFLVTNWHVVTGRNPTTDVVIHKSLAIPSKLEIKAFYNSVEPAEQQSTSHLKRCGISIDLYKTGTPCWREHPEFGKSVDVVALPIESEGSISPPLSYFDLKVELAAGEQSKLWVMDKVFIVGFPLTEEKSNSYFPIFKAGSVASEPDFHINEPRFYIDSKTKKGMSGSPVIRGQGLRFGESDDEVGLEGLATTLIGIYSGRDRQEVTEYEAELGIVWPIKECLLPILEP